jgi:uncharacterized HAD superfamily protein
MKIGFDLDRVLINYPPIVPALFIDWLYRNHDVKEQVSYRYPKSSFERWFRKLTHFYLLRPKMTKNVDFVVSLSQSSNHDLYLVSSRYKFLEDLTLKILNRYGLGSAFKSVNLNIKDEQPHLFKTRVIKELNLDIFIDDDLDLLKYLSNNLSKTKLVWYNPRTKLTKVGQIDVIKNLEELTKFF